MFQKIVKFLAALLPKAKKLIQTPLFSEAVLGFKKLYKVASKEENGNVLFFLTAFTLLLVSIIFLAMLLIII